MQDDSSGKGGDSMRPMWQSEDLGARIAERAYALYEQRGREEGHDLEDWLQAEREILESESE